MYLTSYLAEAITRAFEDSGHDVWVALIPSLTIRSLDGLPSEYDTFLKSVPAVNKKDRPARPKGTTFIHDGECYRPAIYLKITLGIGALNREFNHLDGLLRVGLTFAGKQHQVVIPIECVADIATGRKSHSGIFGTLMDDDSTCEPLSIMPRFGQVWLLGPDGLKKVDMSKYRAEDVPVTPQADTVKELKESGFDTSNVVTLGRR